MAVHTRSMRPVAGRTDSAEHHEEVPLEMVETNTEDIHSDKTNDNSESMYHMLITYYI